MQAVDKTPFGAMVQWTSYLKPPVFNFICAFPLALRHFLTIGSLQNHFISTAMFIPALFAIAKMCKQPEPTDKKL